MIDVKTVKLGELVRIRTGKLDANASSPNGTYPFFTCSRKPLKIDNYSYDCKCVLVAGNGDLNVKFYEGKFDAYQRTYIIESLNEKKLDTRYLYYFLEKYVERLRELSIGGVIKYIKLNNLTDPKIPLPPLEKQKRIVAKLDKADELRKKRKQAIALLDEYLKSVFLEMFGDPVMNKKGWEVKKLSEVCTKITDGTHDTPKRLTTGVKFITGKHIRAFKIDYENSDYVSQKVHEEIYRRCNPEKLDVLYTNIGVNVGTAAVNIVDYPFSMKNVALLKTLKEKVNSFYLVSLLNYEIMKKQIIRKGCLGGAQQFLSLKDIKNIKIPIPYIELQNQFAEIIQKTETIKQSMLTQSKELDTNFNALMQWAFS